MVDSAMPDATPDDLHRSIDKLYGIKADDLDGATRSSEFNQLVEVCIRLYGRPRGRHNFSDKNNSLTHVRHVLRNAFCATGAPWFPDQLSPAPGGVASTIHRSFETGLHTVTHLCPLDGADAIPNLELGSAQVCHLTPLQLSELVQIRRLLNHGPKHRDPEWLFDAKRFSRFRWLIVQETRPIASIAARAGWAVLEMDLGSVDHVPVHGASLPESVEKVLFALLQFHWEDFVNYAEHDWRPFRVPWVYTIDSDPFSQPSRPPSSDTLSWEPDFDSDGEEVDERPSVWPMDCDSLSELPAQVQEIWELSESMSGSHGDSFNPLIKHFAVKAFQSRGMDEFLGHVLTLESALALENSSKKLKSRAKILVGNQEVTKSLDRLYRLRSDFVHGRKLADQLRTQDLRDLRRIVRSAIHALMQRIVDGGYTSRTALLKELAA